MKKIKILIVDDHMLIREAWASVLNSDPRFEVIGEASTATEGISLLAELQPEIVTMDLNLPDISGIEATEMVRKMAPSVRVLGISQHVHPAYARKMIQKGAHGYITKSSPIEELFKAVTSVYKGIRYVSADVKDRIAEQVMNPDEAKPGLHALSKRELEIVDYVKQGLTSKQIAEKLFISTKTADAHRYNILKKLKLRNVAALINYVNQQELITY